MSAATHLIPLVAFVSLVAVRPMAAQRAPTDTAESREVSAVRAVYGEVVRAVDSRELARRDTTFACSEDDLGQTVSIWAGRDSTVRRLMWAWGTDDHAETHWFYYDRTGHLRFQLITFGAVNGTLQEERYYYSADGRVVRHLTQRTRGPGYPFRAGRPIWNPGEWLRTLCSAGDPRSDREPA